MVWRYRVEVRSADELPEDTSGFLNELGGQGWELVSTVLAGGFEWRSEHPVTTYEGTSKALRFFFKRTAT